MSDALVWPSVEDVQAVDAADVPAALVHLSALTTALTTRLLAAKKPPAPVEDELLTAGAVATMLGITKATVYEKLRTGEMPCHRIGSRNVRIPRSGLNGWLAANADGLDGVRRVRHRRAG